MRGAGGSAPRFFIALKSEHKKTEAIASVFFVLER